jgi:hypothetical protein
MEFDPRPKIKCAAKMIDFIKALKNYFSSSKKPLKEIEKCVLFLLFLGKGYG